MEEQRKPRWFKLFYAQVNDAQFAARGVSYMLGKGSGFVKTDGGRRLGIRACDPGDAATFIIRRKPSFKLDR